ncbi:MAG TPA: cation:proton antiporter, partial [Alphaproteobacteria bacterium]|nr:cation:proton antiporter [Alphaproteobacteria bacterium]
MLELLIAKIALIGLLGVGAQWLAWRMQLPAIVLLLLAGVLVGPATGLINPVEDFRGILNPLISIAVAIILFEGGLTLDFKQIRGASTAVRRIVMFGAPLTFALTTVAARQLAGLSWPSALVLSGILVVTGPTVIMPLLRQSRLQARVASMLRWEAILDDPLGALIAMLVFEGFLVLGVGHGPGQLVLRLAAAAMFSLIGGYYLGRFVVFLFVRGHVPEYLKIPLIFVTVIAGYAISDILL